jgi:hypothetical protein
MNKETAIAVVIRYQGLKKALEELNKTAHTEGDQAVADIAKTMSPEDIGSIVEHGDATSPTVLHGVITPEQFDQIFKRIGLRWKLEDITDTDIRKEVAVNHIREIRDFILGFIITTDESSRKEAFIRKILQNEHGRDCLTGIFVIEKDIEEYLEKKADNENEGDWQELISIVSRFPEWGTIRQNIKFLLAGTEDEEVRHEKLHAFLQGIVDECHDMALEEIGQKEDVKVVDVTFTPINF